MLPSVTSLQALGAKACLILLAAIGLFMGGYLHGQHVLEGEKAKAERDIAIAYAGEIVSQQGIAADLADENAQLRAQQQPKDRIITQEIVRYAQTTPGSLRCRLPASFRLLHDAAATGQTPVAEAGPLAVAGTDPVEDAAVIETVGLNYEACRGYIEQVKGWQRRYRTLEIPNAESH